MIQHPDPKVQAMVNALAEQRNEALDKLAVTTAELAESNSAIVALGAKSRSCRSGWTNRKQRNQNSEQRISMYPTPGPITTAADITLTREENLVVQNLSTAPLFVKFGTGASSSSFHHALAAGGANDDGTGGSLEIDGSTFAGGVSFASTSVRYSAYKYKRRN